MQPSESSAATFRPPYRYEASEHGPVTIYDSVDVGWIARVKESLPHKEALAAAMVEGLNAAAGRVTEREGARLLTGGSGDESDAGSIPAPSALHTDSTDLHTCGDSGSAATTEPQVGDTITRVTVSECVYRWELDEYGMGDWYPLGPKVVYEHPKWKDLPGVVI